MSDMKYDAIINSGIKIVERVPIPPELIPKDAQVEIAAKVNTDDLFLFSSLFSPSYYSIRLTIDTFILLGVYRISRRRPVQSGH